MELSLINSLKPYITFEGNWEFITPTRSIEFAPKSSSYTEFWIQLCHVLSSSTSSNVHERVEIRTNSTDELTCTVELHLPTHEYNEARNVELANSLVPYVQKAVNKVYSASDDMLHAVVLTGFHSNNLVMRIVFPLLVIESDTVESLKSQIQFIFSRERLLSNLFERDLFNAQDLVQVRSYNIVSPTASIEDVPIALLDYLGVYTFINCRDPAEYIDDMQQLSLEDVVQVGFHDLTQTNRVVSADLDAYHNVMDVQHWIPLLLYGYTRQLAPAMNRHTATPSTRQTGSNNSELLKILGYEPDDYIERNLPYYRSMLECIKSEFLTGVYFAKIGTCLSSQFHGHPDMRSLWLEFADNCELSPSALDAIWSRGEEGSQYTERTVRTLIERSDMEAYFSLVLRDIANSCRIYEGNNRTAHTLHYITYTRVYTCTFEGKRHYYILNKNKCPELKSDTSSLRKWIFDEIPKYCRAFKRYLDTGTSTGLTNDETQVVKETINELSNAVSHYSKFSSIFSMYIDLMTNECAVSYMDKRSSLTYNKDSVLEVLSGIDESPVYVREALAEDYITTTTDHPYPIEKHGSTDMNAQRDRIKYTIRHPDVQKILRWCDQMTGSREVTNLLLSLEASTLSGENKFKKFIIWSGNLGNNGKSSLRALIEHTFGEYTKVMDNSVLTSSKKSQGGHNATIAHAKNGKSLFANEPDHRDEVMRAGSVKIFSGLDTTYARNAYGSNKSAEFRMRALPHVICNSPPGINDTDTAIRNRLLILEFVGTWTEDAPRSQIEQDRKRVYKSNPDWISNIDRYKGAFMWLMCYYYNNYVRGSTALDVPESVRKTTDDYINRNSTFIRFMDEYLVAESKGKIKKHTLVKLYQDYLKEHKVGIVASYQSVENEISRYLYSDNKGNYLGHVLKENNDSNAIDPAS